MLHITLILALLTVSAEPARVNLSGKVVDAAHNPIPQATVFIYTAKPRIGLGILCPSCYVDCSKQATTDADGKFFISKLDPELLFRVLVVAEGYKPQFAKDVDPLKGPLDVKLETMPTDLSGRTVLRGRVLDSAGKPVVGAAVSPTGCERADRRWWGQMPGVDPTSVTNLHGEFLITGNQGDLGYNLEVEARGFAKQLVDLLPTGEKMHEIRITEGAVVQGRILNDGKPVGGISVGLVQCNRSGGQFVGVYRIATNSDGRYTFANVHPNDDYFVYTTMKDAARLNGILLPQRISVGADGTTKEVADGTLSSAIHRLSGRVILTDGKPIPNATRLLLAREGAWDSESVMIASDGTFSFDGVPEETVTINARIPGYRLASKRNRFQQVQPWAIAMFVDTDKSGLELYLEPDSASQ
jgi:Carboxypeptidase regulatory-like domain